MNTYHFITTPFGKVMHRVACTLSLVLALIVLSLSMHAGTVQVRLIENLRSWCNQSGACADLPAYFQGIDLKVYSDKSAGAREAVASLAHPPTEQIAFKPVTARYGGALGRQSGVSDIQGSFC